MLCFQGFLYSSPDSSADWFGGRSARECLYSSPQSYEESDIDLSQSLRLHALIENIVNFISGDVGNAPAFKEPEESVSTSPQAIIIAMEQQQSRAEVRAFSIFICLCYYRCLPPTHLMLLCLFFVSIVASGGPSSDCGVDFWDGGEKQSSRLWRWSWTHKPQFSLCLSANISQTAVPVGMFWPGCRV